MHGAYDRTKYVDDAPVENVQKKSGKFVQFKRALAGLSYAEQKEALKPSAPIQFLALQAQAVQRQSDGGGETVDVHKTAKEGLSGAGGTLPHLDTIQKAFGKHDVSDVSAHVGGAAKEASTKMGAEAYASGSQVAFKKSPDVHTAAHEAAHVVQQREGVQLAGGVGKVGDTYEQHADAVAECVASGKSAEALLDSKSGEAGASSSAVQCAKHNDACGELGHVTYDNDTIGTKQYLSGKYRTTVKFDLDAGEAVSEENDPIATGQTTPWKEHATDSSFRFVRYGVGPVDLPEADSFYP